MRFSTFLLKYALLSVFFTTFCFTITAQDAPIKYGKIDIADLQMKVYSKDTSAEAVVLGDIGRADFKYDDANGRFYLVYERHRRVKIFKKSGYDWATIKIPLYKSVKGTKEEGLYDLKGFTYNLENGQIHKEKLEKESVFLDKGDDRRSVKRFAFPNVKEGSIIEYSYSIRSEFYYNFRDWTFQSGIPVVWSEFSVSIPDYFNYQQLMQGYEPLAINTLTNGQKSYDLKLEYAGEGSNSTALSGGVESKPEISYEKVTIASKDFRWAMKDVPAIRPEPFMTTIDDYVAQISFELSSTNFPGAMAKKYSENWNSLNNSLMEIESFGVQLNNQTGFVKDMVKLIKGTHKDTLQQITMAYQLINQAMTYDGKESFYIGSTLKKALETKTGNVADINLMLVVLLKELGYSANPVILSTRDNGRIMENYVLLSKFNYVIAQVDINGKDLLLDATSKNTSAGVLPLRCLNGQGRLISKTNTRWVELAPLQKNIETAMAHLDLNADNTAKGDLSISHGGYNGINQRNKYVQQGKEKYLEEHKKDNPNWQITKTDLEGLDDIKQPFTRKSELTISDFANVSGDRIYFNPMMYNNQKENPFKNPDRRFPVDFGTLIEESFVGIFKLPEGYIVEEIPKGIKLSLPQDGGRFIYSVSSSPETGTITISNKITLKKSMYFAEEYETLRAFYDQIVQKHAEQIVLKKK